MLNRKENDMPMRPTVTSAPNIHLISEKTVLEGTHDLEIACYAEGIPTPVVSWMRLMYAKFQPNVRQIGHFLVMENVTMADKGYYTCTAKNRVGTDIKVVSVIVTAKNTRPFVAPLISAPATVLVKYYTDARLVCNVTGYPQPSNRHIPGAKITGGMMFIPNVTKDATGLYTCIATNSIGSSRANIRLSPSRVSDRSRMPVDSRVVSPSRDSVRSRMPVPSRVVSPSRVSVCSRMPVPSRDSVRSPVPSPPRVSVHSRGGVATPPYSPDVCKKAEGGHIDIYFSLMECRASPIDGVGLSSRQLLMNQLLKTKLPMPSELLEPKAFGSKHKELIERQKRQKRHYDKTSKPLPSIAPEDC
ncbi:HMCN [Mytilus edulis]|uniref:HMCN n=1 Tax=Mytilus edulis TaxID=6550 RepID=A0A8S3Q1F0_MYTED|nr:HMCN [Mytilus edulis]